MKRTAAAVFLILSACLVLFSVTRTMSSKKFSEFRILPEEIEALKSARICSDREFLQELTFNSAPSFYDELAGRWFYSVSSEQLDTDPAVRFSSSQKNIRIAFSGGIVPGDTLTVLAYDDSEYREYSLAVTTLPLLRIDCGEDLIEQMENWEAISDNTLPKDPLPMTFTLYDNRLDVPFPVTISEGTVHIRGGSTLSFPKKGLRIKLLEKSVGKEEKEYQKPLLGMRQDGDWLLYAGYNDQERIRNVFSSNLWFDSCADDNSFGIKNGMEYRFVELFLNRQYWGLYALGFPIDAKQMEIRADNLGYYDEFLFKQKAFGPNLDDPDSRSNGYSIQINAYDSDFNNGMLTLQNYFELLFSEAPEALWHNDLNNVIDIWLFMKLGQAFDSVVYENQIKNVMYTIKMSDEGRKILFTPWDADNYWGNTWSVRGKNRTNEYALSADDNSLEMTVNPISYMRLSHLSILESVKNRYEELRRDRWSDGKINAMLDDFEQDIYGSGAYIRDTERWPDSNQQDQAFGLSFFREYVLARLRSMDAFIQDLKIDEP